MFDKGMMKAIMFLLVILLVTCVMMVPSRVDGFLGMPKLNKPVYSVMELGNMQKAENEKKAAEKKAANAAKIAATAAKNAAAAAKIAEARAQAQRPTQRPAPTQPQRPAQAQTQRPAPTQPQRPTQAPTQRPAQAQTQKPK